MTDAISSSSPQTPIRNFRVRFWGTQGSCPLFPEAHEVAEYERLIAMDLIQKILRDVEECGPSGCTVEKMLGGPLNTANLEAYQRRLGFSNLPIYGGDTTCLSVETADGNVLVLDGGSGIRNCSKFFIQRWPADRSRQIYVFGSHEHLDHRSGLPFSQFFYVRPPFNVQIYGSFQFLHALDERYGIFSRKLGAATHFDDPIDFRVMAASFAGNELRDTGGAHGRRGGHSPWQVRDVNEPIQVGGTTITAFDVYHGAARCLGYRIQYGPASFVFCTDHELRHGSDPADPRQAQSQAAEARLIEQVRGADAAYFDGQYFREEYNGTKAIGSTMAVGRIDWGHGCIEDIIQRTADCGIKRAFIGHHDPERTWVERLEVDRWLEKQCLDKPYKIELAKSETFFDL
jgi:Beta-lactamase superfamily domain